MPSNIEIKAVLKNRSAVEALAARLADHGPELIEQEDIFFNCPDARLKLRILAPDRGELIRYQRDNLAETRRSNYTISRTSDPQALLQILKETLGVAGIVRKRRTLYLIGQTRVHLDQVEGLGDFLELEVVLREGQSEQEGKKTADGLLSQFGVKKDDLLAEAYVDLLEKSSTVPPDLGPCF